MTRSKDAVGNGAAVTVARASRVPARLRGRFAGQRAQIEAVGAAEATQHLEVRAGPAAAIEERGFARPARAVPDEGRDEGAEAAEPEVARFRYRGRAQQVFHAAIV